MIKCKEFESPYNVNTGYDKPVSEQIEDFFAENPKFRFKDVSYTAIKKCEGALKFYALLIYDDNE